MAVIELASFTPFTDVQPTFLEQLGETHRRRAQHDPGDDADRGAAPAVAGPHPGAAERSPRSSSRSRTSSSARTTSSRSRRRRSRRRRSCSSTQQEELQQTNEELEEKAQLLAEQNAASRSRTPRSSSRGIDLRGEGRAARALVEVQERVPREHEPRAAHAAQLAAHPREAALRQPGREPHRQAGRVREDDPQRGHRSARADQRHPRPLEGRGREDGGARRRGRARRRVATIVERTFRPVADAEGARVRRRVVGDERAAGDRHRRAAAAAGPEEPALERVQVHRDGRRDAAHRAAPEASSSRRARSRMPSA